MLSKAGEAIINPLGLPVVDGTGFAPFHGVRDTAKRDAIAADLADRGWRGAPIVADAEAARAFTGSHRLAAAQIAGVQVPAVDLADICEACGISLWEFVADSGYVSLEDALPHLCAELPGDIVEAYGLDIH